MSKLLGKTEPTGCPEFAVRADVIGRYFSPSLASSTFHDFVNKGKIVPLKGIRGFYKLNDSLRRLGLREVASLPSEIQKRSLEDIMRFAFTLIDRNLFPEPTWASEAEVIDLRDMDYARSLADQHRGAVDGLENHAAPGARPCHPAGGVAACAGGGTG
jgi:hypothetical protein